MKKFFCYFLGIIFVFLLGLMLYLAKFADEPLDDFTDLEPTLTEVPTEENGFPLLIAEIKNLELNSEYDEIIDPANTNAERLPHFRTLYSANKASFDLIREAIAKPHIQEAISNDPNDSYDAMKFIPLAEILTTKIRYHQANGNSEEVAQTLEDFQLLSIQYLKSDGPLIKHLLATSILQQLFAEQLAMIKLDALTQDQLIPEHLLEALLTQAYQNTLNYEWMFLSSQPDTLSDMDEFLSKFSSNPVAQAFLYQPNSTKNVYGQFLRLNKRLALASSAQKQSIKNEILSLDPHHGINFTKNLVGEEL